MTPSQQRSHKRRSRHRKCVAQCPARHEQQCCVLRTIIPPGLPPSSSRAPALWAQSTSPRATVTVPKFHSAPDPSPGQKSGLASPGEGQLRWKGEALPPAEPQLPHL